MKKYLFLLIIIPLYCYAFLRYHIAKDVPLWEWLFILNKAIAWSSFSIIGLSVLKPNSLRLIETNRRTTGMTGFVFGIIHISLVLILFNKAHFDKLYDGDQLNFQGWVAIAIGLISILVFSIPFVAALNGSPSESKVFHLGKIGFFVSSFHPVAIGISGWFSPGTWPFYLPPITLLAFLSALAFMLFRLISNKKE
jgi:hypothetical protein